MRILVIDDDPVSRQIVSSGLKKAGYRMAAVDCAQAALKELEAGGPSR
jgi:CheY-like chemotaxis protein